VKSIPPDELFPILVADLADEDSRGLLDAVAFAGGDAYVPLVDAPIDGSTHVLEVHTPGAEPLLLLAVPLGPPTDAGFLLRLAHMDPTGDRPPSPERKSSGHPVALRPRTTGHHLITAGHAASLGSTPPPADHTGRVIANKLRIERLIGSGGMGVVYRATHLSLRIPVAVKVLHANLQSDLDFCRRFQGEALAASRLDHRNLTRVLDFGQEPDGLVYIAMEFLDGVDLRTELGRTRPFSLERTVDLLSQVCAGLSHVHSRGIIHRDLKPDNLILVAGQSDEGRAIEVAKLCDFGIAVARGASSHELVGTPEYMSPEQCAGDELDARSDLYACGVLAYEMATGRTPFEGKNHAVVINHHMHVAPKPPSQICAVDPRLEAIILKALAKDPVDRQQSARELRHSLGALLLPPPSAREAPLQAAPPRELRPAWLEDNSGTFTSPAPTVAPGQALAERLSIDPTRWLAELVEMGDARTFSAMCRELEAAIPLLASRQQLAVLWRIGSTVALVADEGPAARGSRSGAAHHVRKALYDPTALAPAAEEALRGQPPAREALDLLLSGGVGGAYALYSVRARSTASAEVRTRFTALLRQMGAAAVPVIRAALARLEGERGAAVEIALDVLDVIAEARDDATGEIVARFLRSPAPDLRRVATGAIVRCWGERSRALLMGLLQDPDDRVRIAAVGGLRELGGVDEHIVRRVAALLDPNDRASVALKSLAVVTIRGAAPAARPLAIALLERLVAHLPIARVNDEGLVLQSAEALVALAGRAAARAVVSERAAQVREPLRARLVELVR
jgi:serine/threonine protein kinase